MIDILMKEIKLSASKLSFLFIFFGLMFFLPGYPVLCGAFFVTLGIFQSFQNARETNDILFSALLPISKKDVVKGKFIFVIFIESCSLILMLIAVLVRAFVLSDAEVYTANALMNANFFALACAFIIFGSFNLIFVGGFFKTAYKFAKPFIIYIVVTFVFIPVAEALHHFPKLEILNSFGTDNISIQFIILIIGIAVYSSLSFIALKLSCKRFETINL